MKELFALHERIISTARKNNNVITIKLKNGSMVRGFLLEATNNGDLHTSFLRIKKQPTGEEQTIYYIDILEVS